MRPVGSQGEMRELARALLAHVEYHRALGVAGVPRAEVVASAATSGVAPSPATVVAPAGATHAGAARDDTPVESLEDLRADIGDCRRCKLAPGRTHLVFGVGNPKARVVFVGEGPGADEDRVGE